MAMKGRHAHWKGLIWATFRLGGTPLSLEKVPKRADLGQPLLFFGLGATPSELGGSPFFLPKSTHHLVEMF